MKRALLFLLLFCFPIILRTNSQEELIAARVRWLGYETKIKKLFFELKYLTKNVPIKYFRNDDHVATIDNKTVKTFSGATCIELEHTKFLMFLTDQELYYQSMNNYLQNIKQ